MKNLKNNLLISFIFIIPLIFCCSSIEETAYVTINLGLNEETELSKSDNTLKNSPTRLSKDRAVPDSLILSTITLTITAEDMDDIVVSVPLDAGEISVEVTPGNDRNFYVIALVADDDTGLVRSYKGETIADLGAGEEVSLSILMRIYETAIIIPDYGNNRL
ncbi:MAG: hypothetical protein SVR08_03220, partial [Spirochaetota bacterium]|nr:hypothetical protein [Spirochaetota bacterium]